MRANVRRLIDAAGGSEVWAVVKADGYGHGAVACAGAALAAGASASAARRSSEARELREALGDAVAIVVLSPLEPGEEARAAGFEIVVSSREDYARLRAAGVACAVHVKADTGMGRWGMAPGDALAAGRELAAGSGPLRLAGLMSHLATADDDPAFAAAADRGLRGARARVPALPAPPRELGGDAGAARDALRRRALRHRDLRRLAVRGRPRRARAAARAALDEPGRRRCATSRPASPPATAGVSSPSEPLRVAHVPVGYADGYPRLASGRAEVLVRGERRPVAATVSMDQLTCVVDGDVQLGDEVVLIGEQAGERITAEELAAPRRDDRLRDRLRDVARGPPRTPRLRRSVIGDDGAVGLRGQALRMPGGEPARDVVGVEADRSGRPARPWPRARRRGT